MSWHFLERWIEKANQHSTLIGKFWITFLIVCRMVIVASVGDRVYNDEQSEFKCNTLQPGCVNVCFNSFSPISHLRFWSFQILFVATPSVMFVIYSAHKSKMKKAATKKSRPSNDDEEDGISEKNASGVKRMGFNSGNIDVQSRQKFDRFNVGSVQYKHGSKSNMDRRCGSNEDRDVYSPKVDRMRHRDDDRPSIHDDSAFPTSTLIRLKNGDDNYQQPKQQSNRISSEENHKDRRQTKAQETFRSTLRSNCSSYTSGVGTYDRRYIKKNGWHIRGNENNNNSNGKQFVWREPTENNVGGQYANQASTNVASRQTPIEDEQQQHRPLTDLIVWVPSGSDEDHNRINAVANSYGNPNSLAEADMHREIRNYQEGNNSPKTVDVPPTAPPEYQIPGYMHDTPCKPWMSASKISLVMDPLRVNEHSKTAGKSSRDSHLKHRVSDVKTKRQIPLFAQHFRWYVANVFLRLCLEAGFVVMQIMLYGYSVPELYKCHRWPCPNVVDCFISRPMEKTIFLWFMFVYSCICVLLNLAEFVYLLYAYAAKKTKKSSAYDQLTNSPKRKDKTSMFLYRDNRGRIIQRQPDRYAPGGGDWMVLGDVYPHELDHEYERNGLMGSGATFASRTYVDGAGNRCFARRGAKSGRKIASNTNGIFHNLDKFATRGDNRSRDYIAFMLDSEDERDDIEFDIERMEKCDYDEMDVNQLGIDDLNMDPNQHDQNDADTAAI